MFKFLSLFRQLVDPQHPSGGVIDTNEVDSPHSNTEDFLKTGPITPEELREPVTEFGFRLEQPIPGQEAGNAHFISDNGVATIVAHFSTDVWSELTPEQRELFDVTDDGTTLSYPKNEPGDKVPSTQDNQPANERYNSPQMMDSMPPRNFSEDERNAEILTPEKLAGMIRNTPGNELVIYTGAGISKGGEKPVWDMPTLQNKLHVDEGRDLFLKELLNDPEALREAFKTFDQQINTPNPTPAHKAIKEILDAKSAAILMTQNGDRNHEASGIRPIHMAALPEFYEFLKGRTDKASLIVTAGLHADELSFFSWIATKNPNVKIVAIDLGGEIAAYPSYLNENDYILPGNAQETLPKVTEVLISKEAS